MPYDWGFQNDPNYGKRMDALLFRRAMNTAQDAADDEKRWAARFLSRSIVGIDTADGREYNGNVPMDAGTFFDKMHGFAQTYDPTTKKFDLHFLDSENQKAWDKLPDDLETRFAFAREHGNYSTVNNRLGSAAGRLASAGRVTEEELRYLTDEEKYEVQSWQGVENAPEAVMKLREMEGLLQKYEEGFDSGKYIVIDDLGAGVEGERFVPRPATQEEHEHAENKLRDDIALLKQAGDGSVGDDPGEAFVTIEPRIRELKALAEKRKTVREYERQLAEENSWRTVAAVSPALTDAGREILRTAMAHKDDLKNAVGDDFMRLARENPAEAEKVAAVIHALQPDVSGHTVMGDAMRAMRDTFVNTVQGAAESIGHTFERTIVGGDEYQARREREAMYRRAFSERQKDWGWWGDATIGFFGTLPYMGIAAIPYAGPTAIALSAANDFEKQVVDAGGDVSRPDFFAAKFGVGVVYAAIERAQVIHPLKGLTDFGKARMYANMFGSVSDFLKVAAHQGMRLGGEVWEEGLQGALEKGFVAWGCGQDVAAAAAKGLVQDMHGSIGAFMPLMVVEGAGTHRMYRRGGLTVDETVQATQMMRGFHDQAEITAGDAKRFGDQYGAMAVAWANAGPDAGRRSKALQARFGLNADDAAMADEVLSRLWKAVAATGDKEAVGEFFAGATLKSAADMLKATLRDATVVDNDDGTQTVRGFIGESGHEVSFTIGREDLALDVTSEAQAPSIVEALNGYGYEGGKLTVEEWLKKPVEERQKLAALYALGSQGYTVNRKISVKTNRVLEDGTEEVVENTLDAKALRILSGDIVLDENTLPQTIFHEAMHGLLKLAEDIAPKELMDALREVYPATAEGETVNEERIANAYRDYLAGKIPAVEYEKDIFDRLVAWIRGLLGLSDASLTIANARTSADVLFNQMLSGDFSGVVEAEKMLDVQLARVERRESGRRAEAEKKEPAPDGGTEDLGKDKFGGEIVAAEDEMVDEDGNVVPPEKMREAIAAGKIVMRREVYEAKKGEIAPNLTDEEKRRAWHLANDDYAGTDEQGRAEVPTPDGAMKVNTQLAVVDRGELITSDDPRFPQDVQNRLGRETSPQVDAIAQAPNPLWLGPAKDTADGAPLVYPWEGGYIVIAGNGRVLGLARGDDEYKSTDAYNSYARATGERFGLNVPDTAHPRLVRVITDSLTDEQLNRLGRLSNKSGKRAEGAAGTRKSDGMAVRDNLGLVSPDMGASLRSPENSAFAFAVASDIGENGLLTSDEMGVAQSGYDRVENALLGWIVNHHEQRDAIQRALEEQGTTGHPDLGIGNILNGIKASAIHLAALAGAEGREAYDITPDIADALKDYIDFRQGGGTDMDAFLAQGDMFQNRPSLTEAIMREFFARRNSAKRVQAILDKYAETAMLQDNATPTLLDMGETAREDIWKLAVEKADAAEESQRRDSVTGRATSADTDGATADDIAEAARQYAEVVARYTNPDGTRKPGWMMAPNGKPTNLTERQWVQVRTENFKRWFGDWENDPANASKVVDENGEPLVVAHSTDAEFTVFRDMQKNDAGWLGAGFYFFGDRSLDGQYGRNVMECFLNVREPYFISGEERDRLAESDDAGASAEFSEVIRSEGHDGVYYNGDLNREWVVFSPSQIKSATDNAGTFSEARPDIRYSVQANPNLLRDVEDALVVRTEDNPDAKPMKRHEEIVFSRNIPFFDFLGLPNERVVTDTSRVRKMQQNHKLTPQQIATLPDHYNSPVAVMRGDDGGYHVLTDVEAPDRDGNIKPVVVYLRPTTRRDGEVVFLASAYAPDKKKESEYYTPLLGANVLFVDENKVAGLSLEEETRSILRTRASGDDVLTASDYSWWSTRNSLPQTGAEGKENLDRRDSVTGVTPAEDAEAQNAVEDAFGTTTEWNKAGYILNNGHAVDMSNGQADRTLDHREAVGVIPHDLPAYKVLPRGIERWAGFLGTGAIRLIGGDITIMRDPTAEQDAALESYFSWSASRRSQLPAALASFGPSVEVLDEDGAHQDYINFDADDSTEAIVRRIHQYFEARKGDNYQSPFADFRYSIGSIYTGTAADYANRSRQGGKDDGPSLLKIGTGEGSQVYGWGLYGSNVRGVAEGYANSDRAKKNLARIPNDIFIDGKKQLNTMTPEGTAADAFDKAEGDRGKAVANLLEHVSKMQGWLDSGKIKGPKIIAMYRRMIARDQGAIRLLDDKSKEFSRTVNSPTPRANLYEQTFFTDRAPGDESHLLKWYEPVSDEQKQWVLDLLAKEAPSNAFLPEAVKEASSGEDLYRLLAEELESPEHAASLYPSAQGLKSGEQSASEFLARAGIDGVKYPVDSYGTTVKNGDEVGWNYVSFRDDNIRVDHKWVDGKQRYSVTGRATPAENVEAAKTEAQRVLDLIGGTELGNAINRDFKGEGQATIIGRTVRTAGDLAAAAQIYRNPCFETFRYFFTKNGKVVWQTAVTARDPGISPVAVYGDGNVNKTFTELNRMAAALEPDGLWILHNHPSGDVEPSTADMRLTRRFEEMYRGSRIAFKGHVILDHDKYAFLRTGHMDDETRERDFSGDAASYHGEPTANPAVPNDLLGRHAGSASEVQEVAAEAAMAQEAASEPGAALTLIAADSKGEVQAIATVPVEKIAVDDGRTIRDYQAATGGYRLFLVGDVHLREYPAATGMALVGLVASGTVTDFIYPGQAAVGSVLRGMKRAGQSPAAPKVRGERVAEQSGPRFSVVSDAATIGRLEKEVEDGDYYVTYRAVERVTMPDGTEALVPPMNGYDPETRQYIDPAHEGDWLKADIDEAGIIDDGTGDYAHYKISYRVQNQKTGKWKRQDTTVAFNPYVHTSFNPFNDQFAAAYNRPNLVVVRMLVPKSAASGAKAHPRAKDAPGFAQWKAGVVASQLKALGKPERKVLLSNYAKIDKVLSYADVADLFDEMADGVKDKLSIPANVMPPALRDEMESRGYRIVSQDRFSVTSLMAGGDATRALAEAAEPTPDDIARALERIVGTGGAQLGADLSKKENAKAFRDWIKALPKTEPPAWLRDGSPKAVFEWYEANMVGKVYSFDIPGYGHREFRPAPGHIGTLVCGGSNKGVIKKPVVGSWMEMVRNGEISGEDVSGWDYKRARMLPRIPIVLTDFDAVVHEVDRGSDVFTFIKKFDTKNGRPNTIVMKLIDDGKTIGPITTHVKDLTMSWLAKKDLILTEGGEVYGRGANNSASRTPFARDNAEGNSQALGTSISQSGAENKQIPQSVADILDGPPAGFRASVTGSAPTGKYGRNDYVVAMAAQDRLRGIDRPPRKYAELAEALGATRFKDDDGSAWVRLADELIEKNRDKLARLAERDIREAVRETARMKAEADFSEHVKKLFTGSARFGEEIGSAGTSAWLKIMRDLAARATGYDLDAMRRDTGADLLLTLMEIMPEKFAPSEDEGKAKGEGGAEEGEAGQDGEFVGPPTPQTWEEWQRNAEERRKHYNTVILLAKEWIKKRQAEIQARENARAKREAEEEARRKAEAEGAENAGADAESGTDEEGAEPEEDVGPLAIPREVIEAAGVDLQNADEFAAFMRAWICDWLVRQNPGTTYADVLDDETRLATYRRTMIAQLRDIADALLDPTEGKASIMAERMIADIRENASANELERRTSDILGFIQRNAIRQKRKGLIADLVEKIKELGLRGQKFDALERDMKRKIRGDHEQYCRYIARVIQMSDNAVAKETEALMQIIEGRKADYEQAAAEYGVELNFQSDVEIHRAYEKLAALQQFGGLKNKMPSYIVAASKRLEEWLGNERMEHERRWGEFQTVCDDVAQAIEAGVKARRDKYAKKEPGLGGRMWQDVEASVRQRLEEMLVGAGPERVEAIAKVMRILSEGSQTLEVKKMEYRRQFEKMMKTAVEGTDLDVKGLLTLLDKEIPEELNDLLDADLYDADGQLVHERQRVRMTWGQAIQLYSSLLQTATYGANIALHGRQDHARAIEEAAHPALIRLAGLMRGIYQERREELSGVVAQVTGLGIFNPDPMYMPAKMNTGVREGLDQKAYAWSPLAKSLTPRVKNRLDFDLTASVMDVFRQRSDESARAIAFGVRGMALRSMLARKSVVDAMARTHGTLPTRRLIEQVTDTLTGGYTLDEARGGIMGLVQSAGTFTTYASLSFNLVTALKQMQSVASWAPLLQGGYLELGRHLLNFDMDAARELCQAPGFVARYGETSFGRMLAAAWADKEGSLITRLARAGMTLIQIGDFVPGILVGQGVYKARVAALLRQNPNADVAAVKEQAATETWALVEECQQTSRLEDTPHMLRRWGVMGKQVTKFATAPIQQVAHEIHTGRMWYEADRLGDKETAREYRRKCINTAIANHVILPAAFYAVATLFGMALGDEPPEEDELFGDLLLQMLVGPFARVFFAGTIVNHFVGKLDKSLGFKPKLYDESSFPAQDTIIRLIDKGFLTASDIANADAVTVANDLLDEIGIVNSPTRYVAKGVRNYIGFDVKKHRREAIAARQKSRGSPVGGGE